MGYPPLCHNPLPCSCHGCMDRPGEVLGFDLETTGIDRFNDVPVSYALVQVVDGVVVRSWSGPHRPGP